MSLRTLFCIHIMLTNCFSGFLCVSSYKNVDLDTLTGMSNSEKRSLPLPKCKVKVKSYNFLFPVIVEIQNKLINTQIY